MAERKQTTLPDGEYLMLADERDQLNVLCARKIRVPGTTHDFFDDQHDREAERSRTIAMARLQRSREFYPDRDPRQSSPKLWQDRRFRFEPGLISETSYYYGPPPQPEIHYDLLRDFATEPHLNRHGEPRFRPGHYRIVSGAWKGAIETLEPGVHEFFPHTVEFADYTLYNHFIFRDAEEIDLIDYEHSESPAAVYWHVFEGQGRYIIQPSPKGLAAKRARIAGRHWARQIGVEFSPIVSRELASALLPLLPDTRLKLNAIRFIPVKLV